MRKRLLPRVILYLFLYCAAFILLAAAQFTRRGNFSLTIGDMRISGRYSLPAEESPSAGTSAAETVQYQKRRPLEGDVTVFSGGLEFRLGFTPEAEDGFFLVDSAGDRRPVFPEYVTFLENEAVFFLSDGGEVSFSSRDIGGGEPELRIGVQFPEGISAAHIPFRPHRSSVIRDSDGGIFNISYNGGRYRFSRFADGLEEGRLVLVPASPAISYRTAADGEEKDPVDFILAEARDIQEYSEATAQWVSRNFIHWEQMGADTDENTVVAWCAEMLRKERSYRQAASLVPASFSSGSSRTWESGVYQFDRRIGIWNRMVRSVVAFRNENIGRIRRMFSEKNPAIFSEHHLIDYLAVRNNGLLIDELSAFAGTIDPSVLTMEIACGILECYSDYKTRFPSQENPFEPLTEQAALLCARGLGRAGERILVFSGGYADTVFNLRLGLALNEWAGNAGKNDWAAVGRSLVFSVLALTGEEGFAPRTVEDGENGDFSQERVSSAELYRILDANEYLPHAAETGTAGIWAWTASPSVSVTQNEREMNIRAVFPAGETHYMVLHGIKPFSLLQMHGSNWRSAPNFESYYDSSGWYYYDIEQILVLKIRHRVNTETVRILFSGPVSRPEPPPSESSETPAAEQEQ